MHSCKICGWSGRIFELYVKTEVDTNKTRIGSSYDSYLISKIPRAYKATTVMTYWSKWFK